MVETSQTHPRKMALWTSGRAPWALPDPEACLLQDFQQPVVLPAPLGLEKVLPEGRVSSMALGL